MLAVDGPLDAEEVRSFVARGFVALRGAFPAELAAECRAHLWDRLDADPDDPETWASPVLRLPSQHGEPFRRAANTAGLHAAFDQLVGPGRWVAHPFLSGSIAVRFPVAGDPGDDGWHVDGSFELDGTYGLNLRSDGRSLLMLFLFSDVGADDAPTRLRVGSHLDVPAALAGAGEGGRRFDDVVGRLPNVHEGRLALATGRAGDVYLCHPFLVHAAQRHRGRSPRLLAQPGLLFDGRLELERADGAYSPVEEAVRVGLGHG
ncbi:MAG: phytanoyl-CoA dioxygenase [Acidimicrobiia bacterium]|nr:phytanoyl-CoA dioxygenase [Acidimicrobiia bacterium]